MEELVKKVASKGGTTEAALKVFEEEKLEAIVKKAVKHAAMRSNNLTLQTMSQVSSCLEKRR